MTGRAFPAVLGVAGIASALNAGIFYAFSSFVMAALGRLPAEQGVRVMNTINVTVITPSFMILFMGTALLCVALGCWSLWSLAEPGAKPVLGASAFYLIGCFGITVACNVPLNDQLAAASPVDAGALWQPYLRAWTGWNDVRTIASTLSAILFVAAGRLMRRQ